MTYPLNNIKQLKINSKQVTIVYDDNTTMTINIPDYHHTYKDESGNCTTEHHNTLIFEKDYTNQNNQPIIDHCI